MANSGSILLQFSTLKDMLDKVNDEIEASIQITRQIESEIVKYGEIEIALAARESELMKETFTVSCAKFQRTIEGEECNELRTLLLAKESLEDEMRELDQTYTDLRSSASAQSMKILQDLYSSNSGLEADIQRGNAEDEQLMKEITELRSTLLSTVDDPW